MVSIKQKNRNITNQGTNKNKNNIGSNKKPYIVIPYVQGMSESCKKICRKQGVEMYFKGGNTIENLLVHPKDRDTILLKSGVIYMSLLGGDLEVPDPFPQASVSTKGNGGPCCLVLLPLLAGNTIPMFTQTKELLKRTLGCLKAHNCGETVTKHMIFLNECRLLILFNLH